MLIFGGQTIFGISSEKPGKGETPPDLFIELKPVPPDENAIINWRRAVPAAKQDFKELLKFAWTPESKRPAPNKLGAVRVWIRENRGAIELFKASVRKPFAQWPDLAAQKEHPELWVLDRLMQISLLEADDLAEHRDFEGASRRLIDCLAISQRGIEADGGQINYLVAGRTRSMVEQAILRLASRPNVPEKSLIKLLQSLPRLDSETNVYSKVLRVEFTWYAYPSIDLNRLVKDWSEISESSDLLSQLYPEEMRRPFKLLLDPSLVRQHPKPLDESEEVKRSVRHFRVFLTNSISPWANRNETVTEEKKEMGEALAEDIKPLMKATEGEPLPLSKTAAQRAETAYVQLVNPIGRILQCGVDNTLESEMRVFRNRTEREATRLVIGLIIFERRKGHLPGSLAELIDEEILDSIPHDFFGDSPFNYSRERRVVWSVGKDGENDEGEKSDGPRWASDDAVWEIPQTKREKN